MTHVEHPVLELIRRRATAEAFDESRALDESEIRALIDDAIRAPSSFNIQHWRFVAVRRSQDKQRLCEAAYGQQHVARSAVTFIVLGDLSGVERLPEIMELAVERGALPEGKAVAWVRMAREVYAEPRAARDEAIRSASLASMTLMLAAEARGLVAGALTGFDPLAVREAFAIPERLLPVMLLAVGYPVKRETARMPRLSVDDVLRFESWGADDEPSDRGSR